ncbi:MAG: hypothetical protein M1818_005428 [Claussenomyces sp. TS43310]|nr:MAG: hypothetical protein M1818_005428 [Claussenomyces sp. TS43310]
MASPCIICLGVIGKNNNPLHISIFPSYHSSPSDGKSFSVPIKSSFQFSLLLSSTLDLFEARSKASSTSSGVVSGDLGLLAAIDERLSAYGFETNTGVKFVAIVDMCGRKVEGIEDVVRSVRTKTVLSVREGDLKVVFRAMQVSYTRLLQNPFYEPDKHTPATGRGGREIKSKRFTDDMRRIGELWTPGVTTL